MKLTKFIFQVDKKKKIGVCCFVLVLMIINIHSNELANKVNKLQNKSYHINIFRDESLNKSNCISDKKELQLITKKHLKINNFKKKTDFTIYDNLFNILRRTIKKFTTYEDDNVVILNKASFIKTLK